MSNIFALRMRFSVARYSFPEQQLLIHCSSDVCQHARPDHSPSYIVFVKIWDSMGVYWKDVRMENQCSLNHYQSSASANADKFFDYTTMIPFTVNQMKVSNLTGPRQDCFQVIDKRLDELHFVALNKKVPS